MTIRKFLSGIVALLLMSSVASAWTPVSGVLIDADYEKEPKAFLMSEIAQHWIRLRADGGDTYDGLCKGSQKCLEGYTSVNDNFNPRAGGDKSRLDHNNDFWPLRDQVYLVPLDHLPADSTVWKQLAPIIAKSAAINDKRIAGIISSLTERVNGIDSRLSAVENDYVTQAQMETYVSGQIEPVLEKVGELETWRIDTVDPFITNAGNSFDGVRRTLVEQGYNPTFASVATWWVRLTSASAHASSADMTAAAGIAGKLSFMVWFVPIVFIGMYFLVTRGMNWLTARRQRRQQRSAEIHPFASDGEGDYGDPEFPISRAASKLRQEPTLGGHAVAAE